MGAEGPLSLQRAVIKKILNHVGGETTTQRGITQHTELYTVSKLAFSFLSYGLDLAHFFSTISIFIFICMDRLARVCVNVCVHKRM